MKTLEEKAYSFSINNNSNPEKDAKEYYGKEHILNEEEVYSYGLYKGFIAGYNEANKWISVEDELPESSMDRLLVKYKIANGNDKFGIAKYFNIGIGNSWIIEGSCSREITHWRSI